MHHFRMFAWLVLGVCLLSACGDGDAAEDASVDSGAVPVDSGADSTSIDSGRPTLDSGTGDAGEDANVDSGPGDAGPRWRPIGPRPVEPTALSEGTIFAAPDGGGADCSEASPCDVWTATERAAAGDVVFMRGGVYAIDRNLFFVGRGVDPAPPLFESYPGETAVLEGSGDAADEYYIRVLGDPVVLRLFEVRRLPGAGLAVRSSGHLLEGLVVRDNLLSGIHVHESYTTPASNHNVIRDCVVFGNSGAALSGPEFADGGNSDGISMSSGIGNRIENCLVYENSDDGIDTWRTTESYVGYSIVYGNGIASGDGMGIKAGGAPPSATSHVEHCLSYENRAVGFTNNSGVGVMFLNNTSWNNASGFYTDVSTSIENNIALEAEPFGGAAAGPLNNSWQRSGEAVFVSTDPTSPDFLRPTAASGFDDIGAYAGREEL